jgi:hypothetical protein
VAPGVSGVLDHDLRKAALAALSVDRRDVRARALDFSWELAARMFLSNVEKALGDRTGVRPAAEGASELAGRLGTIG